MDKIIFIPKTCRSESPPPFLGADPGISKRGGGGPGVVEWFALMPLRTYPMFFVRRVVNNIHIVNSAC